MIQYRIATNVILCVFVPSLPFIGKGIHYAISNNVPLSDFLNQVPCLFFACVTLGTLDIIEMINLRTIYDDKKLREILSLITALWIFLLLFSDLFAFYSLETQQDVSQLWFLLIAGITLVSCVLLSAKSLRLRSQLS